MSVEQQVEQRLAELETKLAFQDDTIHQLNEVIAKQDAELRLHSRQIDLLAKKLKSLQSSHLAAEHEETPPPHY